MLTRALLLSALAFASSPCSGDGSTSSSASGAGGGDAGACDASYTCGQAIDSQSGDPTKLCPGTKSGALYSALVTCSCSGACGSFCADNACQGQPSSTDCATCMQDATAGCGNEFNGCANDF